MTSSSMCVLDVCLSFSWDNIALPHLHNTALLQQPFTQPLCCTWLDRWTLWFCACICCIVCACTHAWIHACVRICVCPSMRACMHACMHICECTYVCEWLYCMSQPTQKSMSFCVGKWVSFHVCSCVLLCVCEQCFGPAGLCPLPSPSSGWCSTSAQLLSSTQWLL